MPNDISVILEYWDACREAKRRNLHLSVEEYKGRFELRDEKDSYRLIAVSDRITEMARMIFSHPLK